MNISAKAVGNSKSLNPTPPISHGAYYGGVLAPGFDVTLDGSGSYDTDIDDLGQTPKWRWDFDYNGSFSANKTTTSALTTWEYSQPGAYTVAVRYVDNDNQTGQTYTFQINVTNPRHYYYIKDHLGSIRTTVDEDGNVSGYDDYYPFGLAMPERSVNTGNPNDDVKFTGYELDDEADLTLYHAGNRMYDPVLGRFMQIDRFYDKYPSMSTYQYAALNPISFIDVNGDSVDVSDLYERDDEGNLVNKAQVKSFEIWASTKEGQEWIADRAQKGFELEGAVIEDLHIKIDEEGNLSQQGIDATFKVENLDKYNANGLTEGGVEGGRLKQTFTMDRNHGKEGIFQLVAVDTWAHETMFHGHYQETSFLNGGPINAMAERSNLSNLNNLFENSPHYSQGLSILGQAQKKLGYKKSWDQLYNIMKSGYGFK